MADMSAASFSERKPSCGVVVVPPPVAGSISADSPGLEMGVPFLMPNWAWVGRRRIDSMVERRKIDRSDLMILLMACWNGNEDASCCYYYYYVANGCFQRRMNRL